MNPHDLGHQNSRIQVAIATIPPAAANRLISVMHPTRRDSSGMKPIGALIIGRDSDVLPSG
jgi:hypothetical protein